MRWIDPEKVSYLRLSPRTSDRFVLDLVVDGHPLAIGSQDNPVGLYHILLNYMFATKMALPPDSDR